MTHNKEYIEEEKLSFGYLIRRLISWINFIFSKWMIISVGTLVIAISMIAYNFLKTPTNYAKTSFVLEAGDGSSGLGGNISSLASVAGFNLPDLSSSASPLFQIDNIQSLYRSRRMLEKTLLNNASFNGRDERLIKRFAKSSKLDKKWMKIGVSLDQFDLPRVDFSRTQDSLLIEVIELIQENHLQVAKQSRKVTILEVGFSHKDELLAKKFNEKHVSNVNQFYTQTKTKKTALNLQTLQKQTDSVKRVLDKSLLRLALIDEKITNPNPAFKTAQVPYQQALIDVQANSGIYQELAKQLELAKLTNRNNMPLIQVIDSPMLPLEDNQWSVLRAVVISFIVGGILMIIFLSIQRAIRIALQEPMD